MQHIANSSENSNVESGAYDEATRIAEVTFRGGRNYQYENVPADVGSGLLLALESPGESAGRYVAANIRGQYPTTAL
ncbi:MAG: KTSC domain-containing protein [Pyrinomonadaceae bacterium]